MYMIASALRSLKILFFLSFRHCSCQKYILLSHSVIVRFYYVPGGLLRSGFKVQEGMGAPEGAAWWGKGHGLEEIFLESSLASRNWTGRAWGQGLCYLVSAPAVSLRAWHLVGVQESFAKCASPSLASFPIMTSLALNCSLIHLLHGICSTPTVCQAGCWRCPIFNPFPNEFTVQIFRFFSPEESPVALDSTLRVYNSITQKFCYSKIPWFRDSPHEPWTSAFILDPLLD